MQKSQPIHGRTADLTKGTGNCASKHAVLCLELVLRAYLNASSSQLQPLTQAASPPQAFQGTKRRKRPLQPPCPGSDPTSAPHKVSTPHLSAGAAQQAPAVLQMASTAVADRHTRTGRSSAVPSVYKLADRLTCKADLCAAVVSFPSFCSRRPQAGR